MEKETENVNHEFVTVFLDFYKKYWIIFTEACSR